MQHQLSLAGKLNAVGLVLFAVGIVIQVALGVTEYPPIPPGIFVCLAIAGFVIFGARSRWSVIAGIALPVVLLIGTIASGWLSRLVDPMSTGYIGIVVQMFGLAVALVAGGVEIVRTYKH